jgi:hypothetical protein
MPLLALLGRCCLHLGSRATTDDSVPSVVDNVSGSIGAAMNQQLGAVVCASTEWLSAGSNAAQVASLGYNTDVLLECLQDAATISNAVRSTWEDTNTTSESLVSQLQEQLCVVGRVLTSFAHPSACNNPACMTFSGPSESSLVQGSGSKCSGCWAARYCSKSYQRAAWKQHKHVCKALAAAAVEADKRDAAG